ncbi:MULTISPECIES: FAD-dependent oxidoreductase [unclassified Kribbella]|uniref:FAD-dependent oxidoreductase n=1 Tax=unclassified Kribbella TaxID=2644121 RepID=UPI0030183D84
MNEDRLRHAVVIGGSMAGILTARVLSEHFDEVTVIERDQLPDGPDVRKGVPQARHLHAFWAGGMEVVERLLPGVGNDLLAGGAVPLNLPTDMAWLTPANRWTQPFAPTQRVVSATRSLLEWTVRSHVEKVAKIGFYADHEVTALRLGPTGDVAGVKLHGRHTGTTAELPADLVVDASGRGSKLPEWLGEHGFAAPEESTVDSFLGYATGLFEIPAGFSARWKAVYIQNAPPVQPRGGIMFPIEGNRWVLTVIGGGGDYPPTDEQGFRDFAASLRSPLLADILEVAEPISPIWGYRRTANRWRHYEKSAMPGRLLVLGDSLCAFNPAYGQGMTVAAKEAEVLADLLTGCHSQADLTRALQGAQRAIAARAKGPWMLSTGSDLRYPTTVGASQTRVDKLVNKYLDRVLAAVSDDATVSAAFLRVLNMIDEPQALFSPRLMPRVLLSRRRPAPVHNGFVVDKQLTTTRAE